MLEKISKDDWQYFVPFLACSICFFATDFLGIIDKSSIAYWSGRLFYEPYRIITSHFFHGDFNDYNNCFWWPHIDGGYNGIVYLNKDEEDSGTNLYDPKVLNSFEWSYSMSMPEQYLCWRPKENYSVVKSFKSRYNSLCLFDGSKFPHGMNITNDIFFSQYRCNQVFFFR